MPPKVNHLLWREFNGALATKLVLFKRMCAQNAMCRICKSQVESFEHSIFLCPWAKLCWFGSPLALKFDEKSTVRFDKWFEN